MVTNKKYKRLKLNVLYGPLLLLFGALGFLSLPSFNRSLQNTFPCTKIVFTLLNRGVGSSRPSTEIIAFRLCSALVWDRNLLGASPAADCYHLWKWRGDDRNQEESERSDWGECFHDIWLLTGTGILSVASISERSVICRSRTKDEQRRSRSYDRVLYIPVFICSWR